MSRQYLFRAVVENCHGIGKNGMNQLKLKVIRVQRIFSKHHLHCQSALCPLHYFNIHVGKQMLASVELRQFKSGRIQQRPVPVSLIFNCKLKAPFILRISSDHLKVRSIFKPPENLHSTLRFLLPRQSKHIRFLFHPVPPVFLLLFLLCFCFLPNQPDPAPPSRQVPGKGDNIINRPSYRNCIPDKLYSVPWGEIVGNKHSDT